MEEFIPSPEGEYEEELAPQRPRKKKSHWLAISLITLAVLGIGVFVAYTVLQKNEEVRQSIIQSPLYPEGVVINGVPVGNMTEESARLAVRETEQAMADAISFSLTLDGASYPVSGNDLGLQFNTDDVLAEAKTIARDGTLQELQEELEALKASPVQFDTTYTACDTASVSTFVAKLAGEIDRAPVDASFVPNPEGVSPEGERFIYTEDQDGVVVDQKALVEKIAAMVEAKSFADTDIPVSKTTAAVTLEGIKQNVVLRSSAFTSFNKKPYNRESRVHNIKKACGLINGKILQPGEVFSMNDTLGDRTFAAGWEAAPAIVQGRDEDQAGGGVCQTSTTMYLAVLKGELEVVYRQGHSGRLGYINGGLDATIDSGRIDLKWKNNTDSPIYIFSYVIDTEEDKSFHVELYGDPLPDDFDEITLTSKKVETLTPTGPIQYITDYTMPAGYSEVYIKRKNGSVYNSYKTYWKDGVELRTEFIDETIYKPYNGETIVGPPIYTAPVVEQAPTA